MVSPYDFILFEVLPYVAIMVAAVGSVYRYYTNRYSISSQSSQLLERRSLAWGSVPFHYGIIIVLGAHLFAAFFPSVWGSILSDTLRLYVIEVTGWILTLFLGAGLAILIARRWRTQRIATVTSVADWAVLASLSIQVLLGGYIAVTMRWGTLWSLYEIVPWVQSLASFNPQIQTVVFLPSTVKLHILNAMILIMLIPFTRLIHIFTVPVTYLWRPYQVVIWNRSIRRGSGGTVDLAVAKAERDMIRAYYVKLAIGLVLFLVVASVILLLLFSSFTGAGG